jgi:D-Tyr-tRNAtyr deacylase
MNKWFAAIFLLILLGCTSSDTELKIEKRVERINSCRIEITRIGI